MESTNAVKPTRLFENDVVRAARAMLTMEATVTPACLRLGDRRGSYGGESLSVGGSTPSVFGLAGVFGGEYFFSSNFSWACEARLGFVSYNNVATPTTTIGTLGFATFLTWYIN